MRKRMALVATVFVAVAACSTPTDTGIPTEPVYPAPAVPTVPPQPETDVVKTHSYGDAVPVDGVVVTLGPPQPYTPSETAVVSGDPMRFHVTVSNRRSTVYQPAFLMVAGTSGTTEAKQIFDSGGGIVTPMGANLLPGETLEWDIVFGVANPSDITLSVTPDIGGTTIIYES